MVRKQLVKGDESGGGGGSTRKKNMARFVSRKRSGRRSPGSSGATVAVAVPKAVGGIGRQISRFKSKIKVAKAKHDEDSVGMQREARKTKKKADAKINELMTELNVKEALLDREGEENARLGSQINKLNKKVWIVDEEIKSKTKELKLMEGNFNQASDKNNALNSQISKLRSEIVEAKAQQEEADEQNIILEEKAQKAKEYAEGKVNTLMFELSEKEARLGREGEKNEQLSSQITKLNLEIIRAKEKQEAIDAEARKIKEKARERVERQERELEMHKSRLNAERGANTSLAVTIAELNCKIQAAKKRQEEADGEAQLVRQKANRRIDDQTKMLTKMETRMKDADAQNLALESEVDRLKSRIEHATNEKQELNNALMSMTKEAEERRAEAETKIEERTESLRRMEASWKDAAARNVALEEEMARVKSAMLKDIKTRNEELKLMEGNFREANDKNSVLSGQISKLRSEIKAARAKQEEADQHNVALEVEALGAKAQANERINALTLELAKAEAKLNEEGGENVQLSSQILKLNKQIAADKARQEALDKEACETREKANKKIQKQEEKLNKLGSKLDAERGTNASLNASIAELNGKILAAKKKQEEADARADRAREEARRKAEEQMRELNRMEDRMRGANADKDTLGSEVDRLKSEIGHAMNERQQLDKALKVMAMEAEAAREQAEAKIEKRTGELRSMEEGWKEAVARNAALEDEMAELTRAMSEERALNLKTIEDREGELRELRRKMSRERAAQRARDEARDEAESSRIASLEAARADAFEEARVAEENAKALNFSIVDLKESILAAKAKQEEANDRAERTREEATRKIAAQTEQLAKMEARMRGADSQNTALGSEVDRLRTEIELAMKDREELDDALTMMADEAAETRERAEEMIEKRTAELGKMEASRKEAAARNVALEGEIAELRRAMSANLRAVEDREGELRDLRRVMSDNQRERRREVDGHIDEIARLRRENEELLRIKQDMSDERRASQRAIMVNSAEQPSQAEVEVEHLGSGIKRKGEKEVGSETAESEGADDGGNAGGSRDVTMLDRIMDAFVGSSTEGSSLLSGGWRDGSGTLSTEGDGEGTYDESTYASTAASGSFGRSLSLVPAERERETPCESAGEEAKSAFWSCWCGAA